MFNLNAFIKDWSIILNIKAHQLITNIRYTFFANFSVLAISIILNLFVPRIIGVKDYSYWQLYVFYTSYVGFFHLGWLDGIYLKIGGDEYEDLDRKSLGSQFWYLFIFEIVISLGVIIYAIMEVSAPEKQGILTLTAIVSVITNLQTFVLYIFQSTNLIKEYATLSKTDRYIYILFALIYFSLGGRSFWILIVGDIVSKLLVTIWGVLKIKDLVHGIPIRNKSIFWEIVNNIKIGSNLLISNIASLLIIGISRVLVESHWSIETFGKLSFTLSISNMFMVFVNGIGVVMFPLLRRTKQENLKSLFIQVRTLFVPFTFFLLIFFQPVRIILSNWLPAYAESLNFMGILFPMIIFEGRMSLLINPYLKAMRKEKSILLSNIISLSLSIMFSLVGVYVVNNIYFVVIGIIFCLAARCLIAEYFLSRELKINILKHYFSELSLAIIFISGNMLLSHLTSFIIYFSFFAIYLMINMKNIKEAGKRFFDLMRT